MQFKGQELGQEGMIKNKEIDNEKEIEEKFLHLQAVESAADYKLNKTELALEGAQATLNMISGQKIQKEK